MNESIRNILLIDDNQEVSEIIAEGLSSEGYLVLRVNDGSEALKILDDKNWYCIICDIQMPHISGMMFLKIIREQGSKFPVIFITGFHNNINTEKAYQLGAQVFISKPFQIDELLKKLEDIESFNSIVNNPKVEVEESYIEIQIDNFILGKKINYPIFLELSPLNFVKIASSGEYLDEDKIMSMKKFGVASYYLEINDYYHYIKSNKQIAQSLLKFSEIIDLNIRAFFIKICKSFLEYQFQHDDNSEILSLSFLAIHDCLIFVSENEVFLNALESLYNYSPELLEHSSLVSFIASGLALQSNKFNSKTVLNVSLAGFFHDIGFLKLPKELAIKQKKDMSYQELSIYKTHPRLGCQILESMKDIPNLVVEAILEHHEHTDGSGFPFGKSGAEIHPIGSILATANYLAHIWNER